MRGRVPGHLPEPLRVLARIAPAEQECSRRRESSRRGDGPFQRTLGEAEHFMHLLPADSWKPFQELIHGRATVEVLKQRSQRHPSPAETPHPAHFPRRPIHRAAKTPVHAPSLSRAAALELNHRNHPEPIQMPIVLRIVRHQRSRQHQSRRRNPRVSRADGPPLAQALAANGRPHRAQFAVGMRHEKVSEVRFLEHQVCVDPSSHPSRPATSRPKS